MTDVASECPFCGGTQFVRVAPFQFPPDDEGEAWKWGFHVICDASGIDRRPRGCGCSGAWGETEAEAISAWNRRTDTAVVGEEALPKATEAQQAAGWRLDLTYLDEVRAKVLKETGYDATIEVIEECLLIGARSPTGGREAGLEEAARWHEMRAAQARLHPEERGTGNANRHEYYAECIRELKAGS